MMIELLLPSLVAIAIPALAWGVVLLAGVGLLMLSPRAGICVISAGLLSLLRLVLRAGFVAFQVQLYELSSFGSSFVYRGFDLVATLLLVVAWVLMGMAVLGFRGDLEDADDRGIPDY